MNFATESTLTNTSEKQLFMSPFPTKKYYDIQKILDMIHKKCAAKS